MLNTAGTHYILEANGALHARNHSTSTRATPSSVESPHGGAADAQPAAIAPARALALTPAERTGLMRRGHPVESSPRNTFMILHVRVYSVRKPRRQGHTGSSKYLVSQFTTAPTGMLESRRVAGPLRVQASTPDRGCIRPRELGVSLGPSRRDQQGRRSPK